jgi:hypothetical protein
METAVALQGQLEQTQSISAVQLLQTKLSSLQLPYLNRSLQTLAPMGLLGWLSAHSTLVGYLIVE